MTRQVTSLGFARQVERPRNIPLGRATGAKLHGLRYQKKVTKLFLGGLPPGLKLLDGPWFEFRDLNGPGVCQPDIVLLHEGGGLVVECKLTYTSEALTQLACLYLPVLEECYQLPFTGMIVCKNVTKATPQVNHTFGEAVEWGRTHAPRLPIWHWPGRGGLTH